MANELELARAQFDGYAHKEHGYSARSLAESMGLKKSEWKKLRDLVYLQEDDKQEIDRIFINPSKIKK